MSNGQKIVLPDVRGDGDVCREVKRNQDWQKFVQLKQVGVGDEWDVRDERELHCLGVILVGHFHLEEV